MLADAGETMSEVQIFKSFENPGHVETLYLMPLEPCDLFIEEFHTDSFQVIDAFFRQTDLHTGVS